MATTAVVVGTAASAGSAAPKPRLPKPTLTASVPARTNATTATFTFSSLNATKYTCTLDTKKAACTSPKTYVGLTERAHTFSVVASRTGARASQPATFAWTVDRTPPPAVTFSGVPTGPVALAAAPDITFSTTEANDTFSCRIDQGSVFACSANSSGSTQTQSVTANGIHTLTVVATDAAGNVGPASSAGWEIDDVGPTVVISDPPAPTPLSSVTVHITVVGAKSPNGVTCTVDNGGGPVSQDCSSLDNGANQPLTVSMPNAGSYTLVVTATDSAGNTGFAQATLTRNLSAALPPVLSGPAAFINNPSSSAARITWTPNATDTYACTVDGPSAPCLTAGTFDPPGVGTDGQHTVTVADSTTGSGASTWKWTLDTVVPTLTVTGGPGARSNASSATFTIIAADGVALASLVCQLQQGDAISVSACPANGTFATTAAGPYALHVIATDAAGNATQVDKSWTVDHTAPTATVSGLASITGPIKLSYSEPVTGLLAGSAALTLTDTAATVAVTRTCHSAAGTRVSCTGAFRSIWLAPSAHLTPGQHYTLAVATAAVHDLAGNVSASITRAFRGERTLEENSVAPVARWQPARSKSAVGGSFLREHLAGAQASYRFRGRSISWLTVTGPTQGKALVRVDGHNKPVVNNYAASTHFRVARTFGRLGTGAHRLTIIVLGRKGARAGRGTFVSVDAFKVGKTVTRSPALTTSWKRIASAKFFRAHAAVGDLAGEAYTLTFRGTSVTWRTRTSRTQGIARVFLDGVLKATVDNFSAGAKYRVARTLSNLTDRVHTLRIVVVGKHHTGGQGNQVTVDRFAIG